MKAVLKETGSKAKPGRKASGLRDLPPEAARLAIGRAALALVRAGTADDGVSAEERERRATRVAVREVRAAVDFQGEVGKRTGRGMTPTLERLLQGDIAFSRVPVAEDGAVTMQTVVRGDGGVSRLRQAGVPAELIFTAEGFLADVERARIGKLTASYGEGGGGATSAQPERMLMAMQRLIRAQEDLNATDRLVVWGALVFGLSMQDIGHATDGGRVSRAESLIERGMLRLEIALERMRPHYLARGA